MSKISTTSITGEVAQNINPPKVEQWEINVIGNFLLLQYHNLVITPHNNWIVTKSLLRKEYSKFITSEYREKFKQLSVNDNIGSLLDRCGFICNQPYGSSFYKLNNVAITEFRRKTLKGLDNQRITNNFNLESEENLIVQAENAPTNIIQYKGTTVENRVENFNATDLSCLICQKDFPTLESYQDNVMIHGEETDFEFLKTIFKFVSPIFQLSFKLCKNSQFLCFEIATNNENVTVENIIIIKACAMYYPKLWPKTDERACKRIYVNSQLFEIFQEVPIIIISNLKDNKEKRIVEQYHFTRCAELPRDNLALKSYYVSEKEIFVPKYKLADYIPSPDIQKALVGDDFIENIMKLSKEFRDYIQNGKKFQSHNIGAVLKTLLQIEDVDTTKQYLNLVQRNVTLKTFGDHYTLKLMLKQQIFLENILSINDEVIITLANNISTKPDQLLKFMQQPKEDILRLENTFVGDVVHVNSGKIIFKCDQKIDLEKIYMVICRPSRLYLRYQYRSLELLPLAIPFLKKFLFPAELTWRPLSKQSLDLYNKNIYDNPEQLQAVRNIAEGPRNDAAYIILGAPGTGKTTTMVEAILQVLKRPDTKILITSSSNNACEELSLRLSETLKCLNIERPLLRICEGPFETRLDTIDNETFRQLNNDSKPDVEMLQKYRIVICSLAVVAKLATGIFGCLDNGGPLYTHLFIDDGAALTEAETLVAFTTIVTPNTSIIIAGDDCIQFGPILHSKRAMDLGLSVSLMQRLLSSDCYGLDFDTDEYDWTIRTRLIKNYRSHPAIGELCGGLYTRSKVNIDEVSLVKQWHLAPNNDYPIIFHSVNGPLCNDNGSQSLYNICEINVVMDYVKDLMYFGINGRTVKETDIGIISSYKNQNKRIKEQLNLLKWFNIETGSVETFQAREKHIIIVSFVCWGKRSLAYLENNKHVNTALSRAKSLLVLIGNQQTLCSQPHFNNIIQDCKLHNSIIEDSIPKRSAENQGAIRKQHRRCHALPLRAENSNTISTDRDTRQMDALSKSIQELNVKDINNHSKNTNTSTKPLAENQGAIRKVKETTKTFSDVNSDVIVNQDGKTTISRRTLNQSDVSNEDGRRFSRLNKGRKNKTSLDVEKLFDELPKVPGNPFKSRKSSEIPIAQVKPVQQQKQHVNRNDSDLQGHQLRSVHPTKSEKPMMTQPPSSPISKQQQQYDDEEIAGKLQKQQHEDKENIRKLQQKYEAEENARILLQQHEENARKLQQQHEEIVRNLQQQHEEIARKLQQQQYEAEEKARKLQQQHEDEENARKLQQQYDDEENARRLQQQQHEEIARKLQQQHEDEENARKLQQQYDDEENARRLQQQQHEEIAMKLQQQQYEAEETARKLQQQQYEDEENARKLQQQYDDEENAKILQQQHEEGEFARKLQQQQYDDEETARKLQQQQYEAEENARKLQQQQYEAEQYAKKLQQNEEANLKIQQQCNQNQQTPTTQPPISLPQSRRLTEEEQFKVDHEERITQIAHELDSYRLLMDEKRIEYDNQKEQYKAYKRSYEYNEETEYRWRQAKKNYEIEKANFDEFVRKKYFEHEKELDRYDNYIHRNDKCCIV